MEKILLASKLLLNTTGIIQNQKWSIKPNHEQSWDGKPRILNRWDNRVAEAESKEPDDRG